VAEKNIIINTNWLKDYEAPTKYIDLINAYFPYGATAEKVLDKLVSANHRSAADWFFKTCPQKLKTVTSTQLEDFKNIISFSNYVILTNRVNLSLNQSVYVKGNLTVCGNLEITENAIVYADSLEADSITVKQGGRIKVNNQIFSKTILLDGNRDIWKHSGIFAKEIICNNLDIESNSFLKGNVKTKSIEIKGKSDVKGIIESEFGYLRDECKLAGSIKANNVNLYDNSLVVGNIITSKFNSSCAAIIMGDLKII